MMSIMYTDTPTFGPADRIKFRLLDGREISIVGHNYGLDVRVLEGHAAIKPIASNNFSVEVSD